MSSFWPRAVAPESILAATATLLILGGGWSPAGVLALLVVAAVDRVGKRPAPRLELLLLAADPGNRRGRGPSRPRAGRSLCTSWPGCPILAPAASWWPFPKGRHADWLLVILLAAAARLIEGPEALSLPVAFALLVLSPSSRRMRETQALWSGYLLLAGTVLAGYPWLADRPGRQPAADSRAAAGLGSAAAAVVLPSPC